MPLNGQPRDTEQSSPLHEPESGISHIHPKTTKDVAHAQSHLSLVDDKLSHYFQSDKTRKDYINMPVNHPSLHLHVETPVDDDRDC